MGTFNPIQFSRKSNRLTSRRMALRYLAAAPVIAGGLVIIGHAADDDVPSAIASLSASPPASPQASPVGSPEAVFEVRMSQDLTFEPSMLSVPAGSMVRWVNASQMPHSATCDPDQNPVNATNPEYVVLPDGAEPWGSGILQPGETFEHVFSVSGHYDYLCIPHVLSGMRGSVEVNP